MVQLVHVCSIRVPPVSDKTESKTNVYNVTGCNCQQLITLYFVLHRQYIWFQPKSAENRGCNSRNIKAQGSNRDCCSGWGSGSQQSTSGIMHQREQRSQEYCKVSTRVRNGDQWMSQVRSCNNNNTLHHYLVHTSSVPKHLLHFTACAKVRFCCTAAIIVLNRGLTACAVQQCSICLVHHIVCIIRAT